MNARLRYKFADEDAIMGEFFFRGVRKMPELQANRNFLAQFCHETELLLANTFFECMPEQLVTYYEIAASPMEEIADNRFAQLDYILCGQSCKAGMHNIKSMRHLALASHHFLLYCEMESGFKLEKKSKKKSKTKVRRMRLRACPAMGCQERKERERERELHSRQQL